eukprot:758496-Hanusia_phi.AAC.1
MSKSYQVSARARFTTELALSRGLHIVRLNIEARSISLDDNSGGGDGDANGDSADDDDDDDT